MFFLEGVIIGCLIGIVTTFILTLNFFKVKIARMEERHRDCYEAYVSLNKKGGG